MTVTKDHLGIPDGVTVTGVQATDDYLAMRLTQGRRIHYLFAVPLRQLAVMLPVPDPDRDLPDNRRVNLKRALEFGEYVKMNPEWHAGPLTVRTDSRTISFEAFPNQDDAILQMGLIKVPRINRDGFAIVDGQHRQLGFSLLLNETSNDLNDAKQAVFDANNRGESKELVNELSKKVTKLEQLQERLDRESAAIDLLIEDDSARARQVFVDVATYAVGVPKSVTTRFDLRKVVHRALGEFLSSKNLHPILDGRVDHYNDTVTGKTNVNVISADKVADLIRISNKGIGGKFGKADERKAAAGTSLTEADLVATTTAFFNVLLDSFPEMQALVAGNMTAHELRSESLLGSVTMLRVLAGVYYKLQENGLSDPAIITFFSKLAPHMDIPIKSGTTSGDLWLGVTLTRNDRDAGVVNVHVFEDGKNAPSARAQDVKALVAAIAGWESVPPKSL